MGIHLFNDTSLALGFVSGRVQQSGYHLTVIVKGTFTLAPEATAYAPDRPILTGDAAWDEDAPSSLRYASDFAPFKPRADVTVQGTWHSPGGREVLAGRASVRVGTWQKTLFVCGDRQFVPQGFGLYDVSEARPFRSMPLRYERAFGGADYAANPLGMGSRASADGSIPLPNWEIPSALISSTDDRPGPAGFGPVDRTWPQRTTKLGTYGGAWLRERWPYFPDDFDWGYFNAAPADQQIPYLRGDESISLEGLHSGVSTFTSRLPGVRPRCFVRISRSAEASTEEVVLNLDTVTIDADAGLVSLVWRGLIPVQSREYEEVEKALLVVESLHDPARPASDYADPNGWRPATPSQQQLAATEDAAQRGAPVEMPEPRPPVVAADPEEVAALDEERATLKAAGVDPALLERLKGVTSAAAFSAIIMASLPVAPEEDEATPPAPAPADDPLKREFDETLGELRAAGADPALLKKLEAETTRSGFLGVLIGGFPPPQSPGEAQERGALLESLAAAATLERAQALSGAAAPRVARGEHLTRDEALAFAAVGASLAGSNLTELDLSGADFSGANLSGANLTGARLVRANLTGADLTAATMRLADLTEAVLMDAVAQDANCEQATLIGANLTGANFAHAVMAAAQLDRAVLDRSDFTGARLTSATLVEASMVGARFDDADLRGAHLMRVRGAKASLRKALLEAARLDGAQLDGAMLMLCELSRATFDGASLRAAFLEQARGLEASFRAADLTNARVDGARFVGGRFGLIRAENSSWSGAELTATDFEGASLPAANFTDAIAIRANFHRSRLEGANLSKARLMAARLTKTNLFRARLAGADLTGADCRGSNLFECDLFEAHTTDTRFEQANLHRTLLAARSPE
jgi:uncharacterized protein YjbI with pentapeptide repeats